MGNDLKAEQVSQAVFAFTVAPEPLLEQLVASRHELLDPEADLAIQAITLIARQRGDERLAEQARSRGALLARCRNVGAEAAFAERRGGGAGAVGAPPPPAVRSAAERPASERAPVVAPAAGPGNVPEPPEAVDARPWLPRFEEGRARAVRVFVSSTFRDMQDEREELIKRVFRGLRRRCEARGVTWGEVDLRWGVSDEEKAEGKVLPICLAEIERCRPYFLGLLGERYGWVPGALDHALIEDRPWLAATEGRSVTELEILHGVLNDPAMAGHAFFYFRDPAYAATRDPAVFAESPDPGEVERLGTAAAVARAAERRSRLAALKERIRRSGLPWCEAYADPVALGALVEADLQRAIDRDFPAGDAPGPLAREAAEHEAFARERARVYVGREVDRRRLDEHALGAGAPMVVLGDPGSGKSALLAAWSLELAASHPEILVLTHFTSASATSSNWSAMLRRLVAELRTRAAIESDLLEQAETPEALRQAFAVALAMAAARRRVVLVIDGLDQLEDREGARELVWLPRTVPEGVRLVVSTLPGPPLEALGGRGWRTLRVSPLAPAERRMLVEEYLQRLYSKHLDRRRAETIAAADQCAEPLFLRTVLEELRQWGTQEKLDARIAHYLGATSTQALYELVLDRWEEDFERDRPGLVGEAMSLLACSRRGLSEAELLELLGTPDAPLAAAIWSSLGLAAAGTLASRSGLITFAHDSLRHAVERRYLLPDRRRAIHERLAAYFETLDGPRRIEELPHQLAEARAWPRLVALLGDLAFLEAAWGDDDTATGAYEVLSRWRQAEKGAGVDRAESYRAPLADPAAFPRGAMRALAALLLRSGRLAEAQRLQGFLADACAREGDRGGRAAALEARLRILLLSHATRAATVAAEELVAEYRALGDRRGLAKALVSLALACNGAGDARRAFDLFSEAEGLARQLGYQEMLQVCLGNRAAMLHSLGLLDEAAALHDEEARICRAIGDPLSLGTCLGNKANLVGAMGRFAEGMALHREAAEIFRAAGSRRSLATSLHQQATALYLHGQRDEALRLFAESEGICREIGDWRRIIGGLANLGRILCDQRRFDEAMRFRKEEERLCREANDLECLQSALGNQAAILGLSGRLQPALELFREQYRMATEVGYLPGRVSAMENVSIALRELGRMPEAFEARAEYDRLKGELLLPSSAAAGTDAPRPTNPSF